MLSKLLPLFGLFAFSAALSSCVTSEVTPIGATYAPRPEGCPVDVFPATTPTYAYTDAASISARCHFTQGRTACIERLKADACHVGGDAVYAFTEGRQGEFIILSAVVAKRTDGRVGAAAPPAPPAVAPAGACTPICSPGFDCIGTACVPQCNPACAAGDACGNDRQCHAAPSAPAPGAK